MFVLFITKFTKLNDLCGVIFDEWLFILVQVAINYD